MEEEQLEPAPAAPNADAIDFGGDQLSLSRWQISQGKLGVATSMNAYRQHGDFVLYALLHIATYTDIHYSIWKLAFLATD